MTTHRKDPLHKKKIILERYQFLILFHEYLFSILGVKNNLEHFISLKNNPLLFKVTFFS